MYYFIYVILFCNSLNRKYEITTTVPSHAFTMEKCKLKNDKYFSYFYLTIQQLKAEICKLNKPLKIFFMGW